MTLKTVHQKISVVYHFIIYGLLAVTISLPSYAEQSEISDEMSQWLKSRFSAQHETLTPIVAVADMLYGCQQEKSLGQSMAVKNLITTLDKNTLAEQLITCLAGVSLQSDTALNYGLKGCFHEQLAELSEVEQQQKMRLVTKAIAALSRSERQKSFTQCVTEQAIHYLR